MQERDCWSVSAYDLVQKVGSGEASHVWYAVCRANNLPVALKVYSKSKLSELNRHRVDREIRIHSTLVHPNILDFFAAFEDGDSLCLVLEFADGGDLFDVVTRMGGKLPESFAVHTVVVPYLEALSYLHTRDIIHRDIKPENTVFTGDGVLKLTDFGLALDSTLERAVSRLGTLDFMPPEVLCCPEKVSPSDHKDRDDLAYTKTCDVWALGCLAYELVVGRAPFRMKTTDGTALAITSQAPTMPDILSSAASDFMTRCLHKVPTERPTLEVLQQHAWITDTPPYPVPAASLESSSSIRALWLGPARTLGSELPDVTTMVTAGGHVSVRKQPARPAEGTEKVHMRGCFCF